MMAIGPATEGLDYEEAKRMAVLEAIASGSGSNEARTNASSAFLAGQSQTAMREGSEVRSRRWSEQWSLLYSPAIGDTARDLTDDRAGVREFVAARIVAASTPSSIVAALRLTLEHRLADRIEHLHGIVDDDPDEPPISFLSLRELALFLVNERRFGEPEIGLSPDGFLQAEWSRVKGSVLVMNFLPDGMIQFAAVAKSVVDHDPPWRVNGMLPMDEALSTIKPFTRFVTT